jgi:hypothetical protein
MFLAQTARIHTTFFYLNINLVPGHLLFFCGDLSDELLIYDDTDP